ncbi:hypothetical protein AGLY_017562 [Aphis glycines]|uniref:RING-type domain-containing protein n=1 Tax=Aphis glycines TaxID=307491 RepID=A0A6G0SUU9_APHGL|nr:hypothetical protein AGLY_017562 [Aphis glycines]
MSALTPPPSPRSSVDTDYECLTNTFSKLVILKTKENIDIGKFKHMMLYTDRLKSYKRWPLKFITPNAMARAGFYYCGVRDCVACYDCCERFENWECGQDPYIEHFQRSPNCNYFQSRPPYTITLTDIMRFIGDVGVVRDPYEYKYEYQKEFVSLESRVRSFEKYKNSNSQNVLTLSQSGLVYIGDGEEDQMVCFCCGHGLMWWEANDNPWVEHARWFPRCNYVRLCQGNNFVEFSNSIYRQTKFFENSGRALLDRSVPGYSQGTTTRSYAFASTEFDKMGYDFVEVEGVGENTESDETILCKICYKERLEVMFIPCGHITACIQCSVALETCSICRQHISVMMRVGVYTSSKDADSSVRNTAMCVRCAEAPVQTVSIPCRHATTCDACTKYDVKCSLCTQPVYANLYVYL